MVKIRLQRIGVKNKPKYRIVVSEEKTKRDGNVIEIIGSFDPNVDPPKAELKKERFQHWIVFGGSTFGSKLPIISITLPSRFVFSSETTIRYFGLFFTPIRCKRIFTITNSGF